MLDFGPATDNLDITLIHKTKKKNPLVSPFFLFWFERILRDLQ